MNYDAIMTCDQFLCKILVLLSYEETGSGENERIQACKDGLRS